MELKLRSSVHSPTGPVITNRYLYIPIAFYIEKYGILLSTKLYCKIIEW